MNQNRKINLQNSHSNLLSNNKSKQQKNRSSSSKILASKMNNQKIKKQSNMNSQMKNKHVSCYNQKSSEKNKQQCLQKSKSYYTLKSDNTFHLNKFVTESWGNRTVGFHDKQNNLKKIKKQTRMSQKIKNFTNNFKVKKDLRLSADNFNILKKTEKKFDLNQFSANNLQIKNIRQSIRESVKDIYSKTTINKQDLIKIVNLYEPFIEKILVSQHKCIEHQIQSSNQVQRNNYKYQFQNEVSSFQQQPQNQKKQNKKIKFLCPKVKLESIKKAQIRDYTDQFMSHYQQMSQSWKRDINNQKRYQQKDQRF